MKLNNNDDSHNSGLNLLIYNMLLDIESHPAWVCGLKHHVFLHHLFQRSLDQRKRSTDIMGSMYEEARLFV